MRNYGLQQHLAVSKKSAGKRWGNSLTNGPRSRRARKAHKRLVIKIKAGTDKKNGVLDRAQQITRRNQNHAKLPVIQAPIAPRKAGNRQDQIENRTNSTKTSKQCVKNRGESARDESAVSPVGRLMRSPPPPHSPEPDACTQPVDDAGGSWGNGSMAQATAAAPLSPEFGRRRRGEKGLTPTAQKMLATGSRTLAAT